MNESYFCPICQCGMTKVYKDTFHKCESEKFGGK